MACNRAGYVESRENDFKSYNGTAKNRSMILMLKQKSLQILDIDRLLTLKWGSNKHVELIYDDRDLCVHV